MMIKTVANVVEETEEYTKYKFGRLICLVHSSWLFYQIINLSIIKLSISRNTQLLLKVEYFSKFLVFGIILNLSGPGG